MLSDPPSTTVLMGVNNRQRRAAKQRRRNDRNRSGRADGSSRVDARPGAARSDDPRVDDPLAVFMAAVHACRTRDHEVVEVCVDRLAALPRRSTAERLQRVLELQVAHIWTGGWQPLVLDHVVAKELGRDELTLVRCVLAAESASYEDLGRQVAPDWMQQLDTIDATRWWDQAEPYLRQLPASWSELLHVAVRVMNLLGRLPGLPVLSPPPSQWHAGTRTVAPTNLPPGLLDKVRGLLAKAESTTFDAEAEAFTAKAQQLMTRHRVDRAVLDASTFGPAGSADEPVGRRLLIADPYGEAKALLLTVICAANGGHCVWSKDMGFCTVFASPTELDLIEDLFTSLLVQATAALHREGAKVDRFGRSRTTRFRRSFLIAFANRIGQRLQETVDQAVADAEAVTGASLVPIFADGAARARRASEEAFPHLTRSASSVTDREGWLAGTLFGDRADLGVGAAVEEQAAS